MIEFYKHDYNLW